jgi:hypothetical protein
MSKKQFYTVSEAAAAKRVTRGAIHEAIKNGRLHAEWSTIEQVVKRRALVISAKALAAFEVDPHQQERGKKN